MGFCGSDVEHTSWGMKEIKGPMGLDITEHVKGHYAGIYLEAGLKKKIQAGCQCAPGYEMDTIWPQRGQDTSRQELIQLTMKILRLIARR